MAYLLFPALALLSALLTMIIRRYAQDRLLDMPNARSSHTVPTPRGGGLAIVITFTVGVVVIVLDGRLPHNAALALIGGGGLVAVIGWIDDRRPVSWKVRAAVHLGAAIFGLAMLGGMPPLDLGFALIEWGIIGHVIGVIGIAWLINLYNFMDGIDGLAAGEAVTVALAGGVLIRFAFFFASREVYRADTLSVLFACAAFGFLLFNWQPAKIFMGDVGSGFLGYVFALLLVMTTWDWHTQFDLFSPGANGIFLWVILLGYFIVDATVTLIRRLLRGDAWYSAHRTHAYQKMVIAGLSHRRVTSTILAINLLWLTPMAGASVLYPSWALPFTLIALAPLVAWVLYWKAGTPNAAAHAR